MCWFQVHFLLWGQIFTINPSSKNKTKGSSRAEIVTEVKKKNVLSTEIFPQHFVPAVISLAASLTSGKFQGIGKPWNDVYSNWKSCVTAASLALRPVFLD